MNLSKYFDDILNLDDFGDQVNYSIIESLQKVILLSPSDNEDFMWNEGLPMDNFISNSRQTFSTPLIEVREHQSPELSPSQSPSYYEEKILMMEKTPEKDEKCEIEEKPEIFAEEIIILPEPTMCTKPSNNEENNTAGRIDKTGKKYKLLYPKPPSWLEPQIKYFFFNELALILSPKDTDGLICRLENSAERAFISKLKQNSIAFYSNPFKKWLKCHDKLHLFKMQLKLCKIKSPSRWMYASMAEVVLLGQAEEFQYELYQEFKIFLEMVYNDNFEQIEFKRKSEDLCLFTWVNLYALIRNPWSHLSQHKTESILLTHLKKNRRKN